MRQRNHCSSLKGIPKMKLQGSGPSTPKSLQSQNRPRPENRLSISRLDVVHGQLSIHSKASLYEAFPAVEARRLVERFEWHYTPKHGSWLNLAESELGVLTSQCLDRRIPN